MHMHESRAHRCESEQRRRALLNAMLLRLLLLLSGLEFLILFCVHASLSAEFQARINPRAQKNAPARTRVRCTYNHVVTRRAGAMHRFNVQPFDPSAVLLAAYPPGILQIHTRETARELIHHNIYAHIDGDALAKSMI